MSYSPWNKLLSDCEFLREEVAEPRVCNGAEIPITTAVAQCPRAERAGMALPALFPPWKLDGNISWVCSSGRFSCAAFMIPWGDFPGQCLAAPGRQGREAAPALGRHGWRMGGNTDGGRRGQMDEGQGCPHKTSSIWRTASHLLCSIPPESDGEGFCLALRTETTSPQLPDLHPSGCTFPRPFILLQPG